MIKREPVIIAALTRAMILLGAKFGLELDETTLMALWLAIEGVLATVVRSRVSPVEEPPKDDDERPSMRIIGGILVLLTLTGCAQDGATPSAEDRGRCYALAIATATIEAQRLCAGGTFDECAERDAIKQRLEESATRCQQ